MSRVAIRVLLIEDDHDDYVLTSKVLSDNQRAVFDVTWVRTYDAALLELEKPYDVCLVDFCLGPDNGLALIAEATQHGFRGPMILLTGVGDHSIDVKAMKAGAADYLVKDQITPELIERVIRHAIERKAADVALRRSEEQLRQSQKLEAIGGLAGGLAHDFNNLLSVILSYSELLAVELNAGDPMRADLTAIHEAGVRAADLTQQLLAFSRQQVLTPAIIDLNKVIGRMEKMLRRVIGEDVELISIVDPGLREMLGDASQMEQVMMNLVVNARDAMPHGGTLTIETSTLCIGPATSTEYPGVEPGTHIMVVVTDTGLGMDQLTQTRIFEPFFTTKESGKGTGLGLSTVFGIVKQSNGAIWSSSELGKGAAFTVCFAALESSAAHSNLSSLPPSAAEVVTLRGSETVLIVEDDERVRVLARTILRKYGYQVLEAQSGGDASAAPIWLPDSSRAARI
jgi:signal transduction histidine kinase